LAANRVVRADAEDPFYSSPLVTFADHFLEGASTQEEANSIYQYRLAGTGFSGEEVQTFTKFNFELVDEGKVADRQKSKHLDFSSTNGISGIRPGTIPLWQPFGSEPGGAERLINGVQFHGLGIFCKRSRI